MTALATTKMSSKGQIVIPEDIRKSLKLKTGDQFVVIGRGDSVILKSISLPSMDQFENLLSEARKQAKAAGLKKSDVVKMIKKVREKK